MGFFSKIFGNGKEEEKEVSTDTAENEMNYVGLVFHFTPHMTYVYQSESNDIESFDRQSNIEMETESGVVFEVSGNYLHLYDVPKEDVDNMLDLYRIPTLGVPYIKITVL